MHRHLIAAILAAATIAASAAKPDPAAYPETRIEAFLPELIAGLKRNLPDAYSVRDLIVCAPHKTYVKDGQLTGFAVQFALNAKNEAGGYTGIAPYAAIFKSGRVTSLAASGLAKEGLDGLIYRSLMKRIASCRPIPQADVQRLLETTPTL